MLNAAARTGEQTADRAPSARIRDPFVSILLLAGALSICSAAVRCPELFASCDLQKHSLCLLCLCLRSCSQLPRRGPLCRARVAVAEIVAARIGAAQDELPLLVQVGRQRRIIECRAVR